MFERQRPDLFELIHYATQAGVRVSLTPSATPLLTRQVIQQLKQCGLARLAVSLDGSQAQVHDEFRGMSGSFDRTMEAIDWANEVGLPVQINTTFSRTNVADFDQIAALMETRKIVLWSAFFLVPTGRGKIDDLLSAEEFEARLRQAVQAVTARPISHQDHGSAALPALCVAATGRTTSIREAIGRQYSGESARHDWPSSEGTERWQRICLRLASRRGIPQWVSAIFGWQREDRVP